MRYPPVADARGRAREDQVARVYRTDGGDDSTSRATGKIISLVRACWTTSPFSDPADGLVRVAFERRVPAGRDAPPDASVEVDLGVFADLAGDMGRS